MEKPSQPIQRALLSVSDKTGIVEFAKYLQSQHIEILSTGGTAKLLREHKISVTEVANYTGFPEIMAGRVKTLHPKIHGGLLGRREEDQLVMQEHDIKPIDLVVVNLYPFQKTITTPHCDLTSAIENIDIGGPAMIRSAAKNYQSVTVIVEHQDYSGILSELQHNDGVTTLATRFKLAQKAFSHTAQYDGAISHYLTSRNHEGSAKPFPDTLNLQFNKKQDLRYGENPHQQAAFYTNQYACEGTLGYAEQLQGKPLSFNNINDTDAALSCVKGFKEKVACVIVKHANPCGVAIADYQTDAYQRAFKTDSVSAFGGIIAFNQTLEAKTAEAIITQQFAEVIIAPEIEPKAAEILQKKPNLRLLRCGKFNSNDTDYDLKKITGGLLVQENDTAMVNNNDLHVATKRSPTRQELEDLLFAWQVVKFVKSNAIVYAKDLAAVGIGAGQMSRVMSANIAAIKAKEAKLSIEGAVMASDAFFPFRDSIDTAAKIGIAAIIQPGGSIRDKEVIQAANEANIAMVFTKIRHFRH